MQEEIANLVHPTITHALALRDRLDKGEAVNIDIEQAALKGLLLTDLEARRWVDFGGEVVHEEPGTTPERESLRDKNFLGSRYALACWIDELFILYSPWSQQWTERKLEVALYGTNDRAWKFWEQAKRAETRPGNDALEVFFLCVMLGFRGELGDAPEKLQQWVASTRARLAGGLAQGWTPPPELEPATQVPPLRARARLQRMVMACGIAVLVLIPFVAFLIVRHMGQ